MQTSKPALELLTSDAIYRENPTALFHQLCGARPATLLLESADIDSKDDLKSLLLVDSALRITALGDTVTIQALSANGAACWIYWIILCLRASAISASPIAGS
jgi:anthranilate synthase component 1